MKRLLDIAVVIVAFVVLALPMLLIVAAVRFNSAGPGTQGGAARHEKASN